MEFLLYLEAGLIHSAALVLATMLYIKSANKYIQKLSTQSVINQTLKQQNSALLKKKELIIQQAFKDAGLKHSIEINYRDLTYLPLNVISQEKFVKQPVNNNEAYLLIGNDYTSVTTQSSWELQWTLAGRQYEEESNAGLHKVNMTFEVDNNTYIGELTARHVAYVKDNLLFMLNRYNVYKFPLLGVVAAPYDNKAILSASGGMLALPDNQLYAVACHEAMHVKLHHCVIKTAVLLESFYLCYKSMQYILRFLPTRIAKPSAILLSYCFMKNVYMPYIDSAINRQHEKSADIKAAMDMGAARGLSEYKESTVMYTLGKERKVSSLTDRHPSSHERMSYLSKYLDISSLFSASDLPERLKQEEEKNYPKGQLAVTYRKA